MIDCLDKTAKAYKMETGSENRKVMINNPDESELDIRGNGTRQKTVKCFKYLGPIVTDGGSKSDSLSRIFQTTAALAKLKTLWKEKNIRHR